MAKKDIHPKMHKITLVLTDGSKIETMSTYGSEGTVVTLESDPSVHRAWRKDKNAVTESRNTKVTGFNAKFGDFGAELMSKKDKK
jgi:large subunit ribosomal protein L31